MKKSVNELDGFILNSIVDNLEVSINVFDKNGKRIFVNPFFYQLSGRAKGSRISDNMISGENKKKGEYLTRKVMQTIKTGKVTRIRNFFHHNTIRRKRTRKYFNFLIGPLRDNKNEIIGAYTFVTDATAHYLARRRLQRLNNELEKQVAERTKKLATLYREKDILVSDIAHEIKTILTIIKGNMDMLDFEEKNRNPLGIECHNEIQNEIERMNKITSSLVFIAKSENYATTFKLREVNLARLLAECIKRYRTIAKNKIKIMNKSNSKENLTILGDRDKLLTLLENLIENSIKFSRKEAARLWIDLRKKGNQILITFEDNGNGIENDKIDFIFNPFFQADKTNSRNKSIDRGFGLGLAICNKIVEAHKGKITVSSEGIDQGTIFRINLPVAQRK